MDKPIVAVIQHKLIVTKSLDELLRYYHRFLRIAKTKGGNLAIFPEHSGLAIGIPMFPGWRNALLKEAATPKQGFVAKLKGALAGSAANVVRADLQKSLRMTLSEMPESLVDIYASVFSDLARQYEMTIVGGSLYTYDVESGSIRNTSFVFGPDGALLGSQAQVVMEPSTLDIAQPGAGWQAIETPVGRIGILFGFEALYPEPARLLAYQGADMLLTIAATKRPATYQKIRQGTLARCQENQIYGALSFLVGSDPFAAPEDPVFLGKSGIFAPLDFTPRFSGIMTELGSPQAEGVITAEWDYPALEELWETSETPLRRQMPLEQAGLLAQIYGRALTLDDSRRLALTAESDAREKDALLLEPPETPVAAKEPTEEELSADEAAPTEEDILSVIAPILPTEPPLLSPEEDQAQALGIDAETAPPSAVEAESPLEEQPEESNIDEMETSAEGD